MGGVNMKLMQGIGETENQMKKEKTTQKPEEEEKMENDTRDIQKTIRKAQTAKEQSKVKKNIAMRKNNETNKIQKKQVFSFRALIKDISMWRAYAVASGKTMEDICNVAMNEYLKKHRLAGAEHTIFEALKARDGVGKE